MTATPNPMSSTAASHDEIVALCGDIDDWKVAAILASGATLAEIEEAVAWSAGEDDVMGAERKSLSGRVAEVYAILTRDEYPEDDRA